MTRPATSPKPDAELFAAEPFVPWSSPVRIAEWGGLRYGCRVCLRYDAKGRWSGCVWRTPAAWAAHVEAAHPGLRPVVPAV